ncbi:MAG: LacI family transcriptional regulator [Clostridiaceae bacterium]|nr:LacI family transcriptional regulator [Clostridiaceae bacterium]
MASNIKDVAKLANVSISTVSRVINNVTNVQSDTKLKVIDAIEKLNFKPNKIAQILGGGFFNCIGIVSTRSSNQAFVNPYFSTILQAIGEVGDTKDYDIILNSSSDCLNII